MSKNKVMNQEELVLEHLRKGFTIDRDEAFNRWEVRRLGAVIYTLRNKGWVITTSMTGIALYKLARKHKLSLAQRVKNINLRNKDKTYQR